MAVIIARMMKRIYFPFFKTGGFKNGGDELELDDSNQLEFMADQLNNDAAKNRDVWKRAAADVAKTVHRFKYQCDCLTVVTGVPKISESTKHGGIT